MSMFASVPWTLLFAGEASSETLAKTLLLAVFISHGTPVVTQEVAADAELLRFVGALSRLRREQAALLLPHDFDGLRTITWHGASAGKPSSLGPCAQR